MEGLELLLSSVSEHHSRGTVTSGTLNHSGFSKLLIQNLHKQQQDGQFCDIAIRLAGNRIIQAHACVLAAQSPYIAMYLISYASDHRTEGSSHFQHLDLSDIKMDIFEVLLKYFYTGALSLTLDQVGDIYHTAIMLQIDPVKELCIDFLKQNITIDNHFEIFHLAQSLNIVTVVKAVVQFVITNFSSIERPIVLREFSYGDLVYALRACNKDNSPELEARKLNIVFRWLCHKPSDRIPVYTTAIESIDYHLIRREQFINLLYEKTCQEHGLHENALVQNIVTYAKFSDERHKEVEFPTQHNLTQSYLQSLEDVSQSGDSSETQDNLSVLEEFHLNFESAIEAQKKSKELKDAVGTEQALGVTSVPENCGNVRENCDVGLINTFQLQDAHAGGTEKVKGNEMGVTEQKQISNAEFSFTIERKTDQVTNFSKTTGSKNEKTCKSKKASVKKDKSKANKTSSTSNKKPKQNKGNQKKRKVRKSDEDKSNNDQKSDGEFNVYPDGNMDISLLAEAAKSIEGLVSDSIRDTADPKHDCDTEYLLMNWSCSSEDAIIETPEKQTSKKKRVKNTKPKKKGAKREPSVKGEYRCLKCQKVFRTQCSWKHHMLGHGSDEPYLCEICGFATRHIGSMSVHKKQHTGNKFKCDFPGCSYETVRKERIISHNNFHKGIKEFECGICGKTFTGKKHLQKHEKTHDPQKRFCCTECEYGSNRQDKYREHVRKHHQVKALELGFLTLEEIEQGKAPKVERKRRSTAISPKRQTKNTKVSMVKELESSLENTGQTMTMPVFIFTTTPLPASQSGSQSYQTLVTSTVQQPVTLENPLPSFSQCLGQSESSLVSHDSHSNSRPESFLVSHAPTVAQSQCSTPFVSAGASNMCTDSDDVLSYLTSTIDVTNPAIPSSNNPTQQSHNWTFNTFT